MRNLKDKTLSLLCLLALFSLFACSPSEEEINATQTKQADELSRTQTASAPTNTPSPSPTLTATPSPTPTPIPEPDPKAMIHWEKLDLPPEFLSMDPAAVGIGEGDIAVSRQLGDGTVVSYTIEGGFVFADEWPEGIYGYTALFPTASDKEFHDRSLSNLVNDMKSLVIYGFQAFGVSEPKAIPDASGIGDISAGAEITYSKMGKTYRFYFVKFRVGDIGGNVFLRHVASEDPVISASDLARIYAESILNPVHSCTLTSANPVEDETWPTFDIRAEGFYPGEARAITLTGDVMIEGENKTATTALLGMEGQSADDRGKIEERVSFQTVGGEDTDPPGEVEIKIYGYHSGCEIVDVLPWNTTIQGSTPEALGTPIAAPNLGETGNPIVWAIVPKTDVNVMTPAMEQVMEGITERTGIVIETLVLDNDSQIVDRLCSGEAHFAALSPFGYLLAAERGCAQGGLAAVMQGNVSYRGEILINQDSGITSVADLAGSVFCRTSSESKSSWIVPSLMMYAAGVDPENDLAEIIDAGGTKDVLSAIYSGECDAGGVFVDARTTIQGEFPDVMEVVQVLSETVPIPYDRLTFSSSVPDNLLVDLEGELESIGAINAGQVLYDLFGWEGIQKIGADLYDPLLELIQASGVEIESLVQ